MASEAADAIKRLKQAADRHVSFLSSWTILLLTRTAMTLVARRARDALEEAGDNVLAQTLALLRRRQGAISLADRLCTHVL